MITLVKLKKQLTKYESISDVSEDKTLVEIESEKMSKILPDELYKKVARIVGLDENIKEKLEVTKKRTYKKFYKGIRHLTRALHFITIEKDFSEEYYSNSSVEPPTPKEKHIKSLENPYFDFFQKSEREQVNWESKYLPPETELEKGLIRRADDSTNKICSEFCVYMQQLGGYDSPLFKEETVKQLFEIEFNMHVNRSLKLCPVELKSVPHQIAIATNCPKLFHKEVLKDFIKNDIRAERKVINNVAFGKKLPKEMQWKPPMNNTKEVWTKIPNIPNKSTTMENVWGDIITLKSVQDFCEWILNNPDRDHPYYLKKVGLLDPKKLKKLKSIHQYDAINQLPKNRY